MEGFLEVVTFKQLSKKVRNQCVWEGRRGEPPKGVLRLRDSHFKSLRLSGASQGRGKVGLQLDVQKIIINNNTKINSTVSLLLPSL